MITLLNDILRNLDAVIKELEPLKENMIVAGAGSLVLALIGGWDTIFTNLLVLMILDYLTGIGRANATKTLNSSRGFNGMGRKTKILVAVIVGSILDSYCGFTGSPLNFRNYIILAYSYNEVISILENLRQSGVWIPPGIEKRLEKLKILNESEKTD